MNHIKLYEDYSENSKRFYYSCVGYGVFSLVGQFYRMGRIEVFDRESNSGYAIQEGFYCIPFDAASKFEDMMDDMETDFPIHFDLGSMEWCDQAVSERIGVPVDKLNDQETKKEYFKENPENNEDKPNPRYRYSCIGYGVYSLVGEFYRMGRIEVFDNEEDSGYQISEGFFCLPFEVSGKFEGLVGSLSTEFPMHFNLGGMDLCRKIVSEKLGILADKLNDLETKKKYYREKYIKQYGYTPEEGMEKIKNWGK
jgi:hypothetical protein